MNFALPLDVVVFVVGTFVAAFVTGVAGFAFGLVAGAIWLFALPPVQIPTLIVSYAILVQGYAVWRLRKSIAWQRIWPFLIGSAIGVPIGVIAQDSLSPAHIKVGVASLIILFSLYSLLRPKLPSIAGTRLTSDGSVGVVNGIIGATTGLAGILVVVWSSMRGWPAAEQRAVFQPTAVATFAMCLVAFGASGAISQETMRTFAIGLPALVLGTLAGWALYGKLDEAMFRKVVLWLLLASGVAVLALGR